MCINGSCIHTGSLCSLELATRNRDIGFIFNCGDQCRLTSSIAHDSQCTNLFNTLGIERCNQRECDQRVYNLTACITVDNEINATNAIDSLCTLRLVPRIGGVGINVNCGDQCGPSSSFQYDSRCIKHFNSLGIQQCNQPECNQTVYDLSTCITADTEINTTTLYTTTNQNTDCQCNRDRDADTSSIATTGQSQACIPTIVYITETIDTTEVINSSTNQQSTAIVALATIIAILIVLLVIISVALIWTCWILKTKGTRKSQNQYR